MSPESFEALFKLVEPYITKKSTKLRNPIPAKVRLAVTLRFLASGETQQSLSWSFRIGRATVSHIVRETCQAIWNVLSPVYLKSPKCRADWMKISEDFLNFWQFPHCVGAIDGKHVAIECPRKLRTQFYNYKGFIDSENDDGSIKEGDWRKIVREGTALSDLPSARGGRRQLEAKELQTALKHYLNSENGMVEWQLEYVRRTGKQG